MDALEKLWARIPPFHCKGLCQGACGPVACSTAERQRILDRHGLEISFDPRDLKCELLKDGRCSIYGSRPAICRLFGAVERMACPYGCHPKRFLPDRKVRKIMRALDALVPGPLTADMQNQNTQKMARA